MGSHLTDKLMMDGHEVTVVANFFTGRKRNVEHWIGHENFELINHDVVEPLYIEGECFHVSLLMFFSYVRCSPSFHMKGGIARRMPVHCHVASHDIAYVAHNIYGLNVAY